MRAVARVAFAGASGTGKSTLAEWLAAEAGAELCPVGARSTALAMGLVDGRGEPDPYLADARGLRREFQQRLIDDKTAWEGARDRFVADRTTIDNAAYMFLHSGAVTAAYLRQAVAGMARYDAVFYCPTSAFLHLGGDGARVGGRGEPEEDARAYHDVYDALVFALLMRHRHDMVVLAHPGLEERRAIVAARVGLALPAP